MSRLYTCPGCGRRGVTYNKERTWGSFRCRYCGHYPGWIRPPEKAKDRRTLIRQN